MSTRTSMLALAFSTGLAAAPLLAHAAPNPRSGQNSPTPPAQAQVTPGGLNQYDQYLTRASVTIKGTEWDFYKKNRREMSADFAGHGPHAPKGLYIGIMQNQLDADGKPVFAGGGHRVDSMWMDALNRPIMWPVPYILAMPGDRAGSAPTRQTNQPADAVTREEDVHQWFRDTPGVNETYEANITLTRDSSGVYTFDSLIPKGRLKSMGLRPNQNDSLGNIVDPANPNKRRYSFQAETTFVCQKGAGWWLNVEAQDDVWVYIDGKLVIDLGGSYKQKEKRPFGTQRIDLDRLTWLTSGQTCTLKIFMVDRDTGSKKSHLKITTNIALLNIAALPVYKPEMD